MPGLVVGKERKEGMAGEGVQLKLPESNGKMQLAILKGRVDQLEEQIARLIKMLEGETTSAVSGLPVVEAPKRGPKASPRIYPDPKG